MAGNQEEGRKWIGSAISQLRILEEQLTWQNLKQGHRTVRIGPGVIVECVRCFHMAEVVVHAIFPVSEEIPTKIPISPPACFCGCSTSVGIVINAPSKDIVPPRGSTYNVEICVSDGVVASFYIVYLGITSIDYFNHKVGDVCLVITMEREAALPVLDGCLGDVDTPWRISSMTSAEVETFEKEYNEALEAANT